VAVVGAVRLWRRRTGRTRSPSRRRVCSPHACSLSTTGQDREAGGISSVERHGAPRRFRILSLSVGIVTGQREPGIDYRRLVEIAAEVKAAAKRSPGAAVVSNARDLASGPWLPSSRHGRGRLVRRQSPELEDPAERLRREPS
jgi:hypothetical protein